MGEAEQRFVLDDSGFESIDDALAACFGPLAIARRRTPPTLPPPIEVSGRAAGKGRRRSASRPPPLGGSSEHDVLVRAGRWMELAELIESRAATGSPGAEMSTLLQAASVWADKVGDAARAIATYERVRAAEPDNVLVLERLTSLYRDTTRWESLVDVLLKRVELADERRDRVAMLIDTARVYADELSDAESAFVVAEAAFREDPTDERSLAILEQLAAATDNWPALMKQVTEVVGALESTHPRGAATLWARLATTYERHGHPNYALHAAHEALRLDAGQVAAQQVVATSARTRRRRPTTDQIIYFPLAEMSVQNTPNDPEGYARLARALATDGETEAAAQVLATARDVGDPGLSIDGVPSFRVTDHARYLQTQTEDSTWRTARHRVFDEPVGRLLSSAWFGAALATTVPARKLRLRKPLEESDDRARRVERIRRTLCIDLPIQVFDEWEHDAMFLVANTGDDVALAPSLVLGRGVAELSDAEFVFRCTRALAMLRPELYLTVANPTPSQLSALVFALADASGVGADIPAALRKRALSLSRKLRGTLQPHEADAVRQVFADAGVVDPITDRWFRTALLTPNRFAFLMWPDISVARRVVAEDLGEPTILWGGQRMSEALADLTTFSVSMQSWSLLSVGDEHRANRG